MRININEKYAVTSDKYQFILSERHTYKEGKSVGEEVLRNSTFHPKLSQLVSALLHKEMKESELNDLKSLCELIEKTAKQCEEAFIGERND